MVGFLYSRAAMSIGMFIIISNSILNPNVVHYWKLFIQDYSRILWVVYYLLIVFSGLYSDSFYDYVNVLQLKLPFFFLPFSFIAIKEVPKKQIYSIYVLLLTLVTFEAISASFFYFQNQEIINQGYSAAQVLKTPINHIRFSLLVAFSIIIGLEFYLKKRYVFNKVETYFYLGFSIFLFLFIHLLSTRSAIFSTYLALLVYLSSHLIKNKKWLLLTTVYLLFISFPILAYFTSPTFQNKVGYMKWDLAQYQQENFHGYSDAKRIISMKTGIIVGTESPCFGVSPADLSKKMADAYRERFPNLQPKHYLKPHNQFISTFASMGVVGVLALLAALFFTIFKNRRYQNAFFLAFFLICFFSLFPEATFEGQIGIGFYLVFSLLGMNQLDLDE